MYMYKYVYIFIHVFVYVYIYRYIYIYTACLQFVHLARVLPLKIFEETATLLVLRLCNSQITHQLVALHLHVCRVRLFCGDDGSFALFLQE